MEHEPPINLDQRVVFACNEHLQLMMRAWMDDAVHVGRNAVEMRFAPVYAHHECNLAACRNDATFRLKNTALVRWYFGVSYDEFKVLSERR